jgi:hypothetical protein
MTSESGGYCQVELFPPLISRCSVADASLLIPLVILLLIPLFPDSKKAKKVKIPRCLTQRKEAQRAPL